MQDFPPETYPNLARMDERVSLLLGTEEAKTWSTSRCEVEICNIHPVYWLEEYGFIRKGEMEGGSGGVEIISFKLNTIQLQIADRICKHLLDTPWTRIQKIVLKHRKAGVSTLIAGFDYWLMRFIKNFSVFLIADLMGHTDNIASMVELFHERDVCGSGLVDETMRPPVRVALPRSKKGMKLSNGSMLELDSGENSNPGTSGTVNACHMSENSKWRDPQTAETSLLNSIPRKGFVFIVKESTAFGLNKYAQDCELAEKGKSNWDFIFITWKDLPDCEYELLPNETLKYTQQEEELIRAYALRPGHIKYRRSQIELLGSEQQFKQDFPLNSREPFLISGFNYFNVELITRRMEEINFYRDWKSEGWDYVMCLDRYQEILSRLMHHPRGLREGLNSMEMGNTIPLNVMLATNKGKTTYTQGGTSESGALTVFQFPARDHLYLATVDVAEGIRSSEYTSDNSIVTVFDVHRKEQVAEWGGVFDEEMTALYAVLVAKFYNKALIVPEMNNRCGGLLQKELEDTGYKNFYFRQKIQSQQTKREFGWLTTVGNKQNVCGQLKLDFKNGDCLFHSLPLLEEMLFFIDNKGRLGASSAHTDDRVMTASVGMKVIADTPEYHKPRNAMVDRKQARQIFSEFDRARPDTKTPMIRRYR